MIRVTHRRSVIRYVGAFLFLSIGLTYHAIHHKRGGWWLLLLWPAMNFLVIAVAYAAAWPRLSGKRSDGTLAWWSRVVLLPYHLSIYVAWWLGILLFREPVCAEVAPGVWVGRRAGLRKLPQGIAHIIDFTTEFAAPRSICKHCAFVCIPTLDGTPPDLVAARAAMRQLLCSTGGIYIHCAQGHSRSASFAAAFLVRRGLARDVDHAVQIMILHRPSIRLRRAQRLFAIELSAADLSRVDEG